mmetsp:Transcript_38699/g.93948  ORF Transcript_38699/g.93948 Transcript_38699/m.93948 type:complete len:166 (-) Transcript_38699:446-943(-)
MEASAANCAAARLAQQAEPVVELPVRSLLRPIDADMKLHGVGANHAPGDKVVYTRASGPVPFGERGIVLAVQGTKCEVIFERESFCSTGHFASLQTCRAAVVSANSLLNISRPLPHALRPGTIITKEGKMIDAQGEVIEPETSIKGLSTISNRYSVLTVETFHSG